MKILLTVYSIEHRTGSEMYVRDLALELHRQGHEVAISALCQGPPAEELRTAGVLVPVCLEDMPWRPEIIHGQHRRPTLRALLHFPGVPAIHVCHDHTLEMDRTPLHPRIRRHFAVSRVCLERLLREGVEPGRAALLLNWVDLARFPVRGPLPDRPGKALVFSNYAREGDRLAVIQEACAEAGIPLDVVGLGVGKPVAEPGEILGRYDLVFAKAKAAMEAMATGAAVVLCDFAGVGPMVDAGNFHSLRPMNFGFQALTAPFEVPILLERIRRYSPSEALRVREFIRSEAGLEDAARALLRIYGEVLEAHGPAPAPDGAWSSMTLRRECARLYGQDWFRPLRRVGWLRRYLARRI